MDGQHKRTAGKHFSRIRFKSGDDNPGRGFFLLLFLFIDRAAFLFAVYLNVCGEYRFLRYALTLIDNIKIQFIVAGQHILPCGKGITYLSVVGIGFFDVMAAGYLRNLLCVTGTADLKGPFLHGIGNHRGHNHIGQRLFSQIENRQNQHHPFPVARNG